MCSIVHLSKNFLMEIPKEQKLTHFFVYTLFGVSVLICGFGPLLGIQLLFYFSFLAFFAAILGVFLLPLNGAIGMIFYLLTFSGFFKLSSGHHPILYGATDLGVIALTLKLLLQKRPEKCALKSFLKVPLFYFFLLHFFFYFSQFFNPYSLGVIPSLLTAKVYVTMYFLYFIGYRATKTNSDFQYFVQLSFLMLFSQLFSSFLQLAQGPESVLFYGERVETALKWLSTFRPYGFTSTPGAPAVFCSMIIPFLTMTILNEKRKTLWIAHLCLGALVWLILIYCQIRAHQIRAFVGQFIVLSLIFYRERKLAARSLFVLSTPFLMAGLTLLAQLNHSGPQAPTAMSTSSLNHEVVVSRFMSFGQPQELLNARRGTLERLKTLLNEYPFGAGLGRTGAASGALKPYIAARPLPPPYQNGIFADQFWIASTGDLGILGSLNLTLIFLMILTIGFFKIGNPPVLAIWASLFGILIGIFTAEGVLYNPEAAFFWFFSGVMLKLIKLNRSGAIL